MDRSRNRKIVILVLGILAVTAAVFFSKELFEKSPETYVTGTIEGNHYENKWIGIKLDVSQDFHMHTKNELKQRMQEAEEEKNLLMDMCVSNDEMGSMTIYIESCENTALTAREYLEKKRKEMLAKSGEVIIFNDEGEFSKEVIAGEEYECLKISYSLEDLSFCSEYYVRIIDNCAVMIQIDYDPTVSAQRDELFDAIQEF